MGNNMLYKEINSCYHTGMNILGFGLPELIVIALILLLFFGKDRLPGLFRAIGSSIKELKDGLSVDTTKSSTTTTDTPPTDPEMSYDSTAPTESRDK
jgi:sec-independent protein translocase protein TatA